MIDGTSHSQNPRIQVGLKKLAEGSTAVHNAINSLDDLSFPGEAERRARKGLATLRSAVDWLEDTDAFERAHLALDDAGRQVRLKFGCHLDFEPGKGYSQTCPVALAHTRVGSSFGGIVEEVECSICQRDPEDCDHITGEQYDDQWCYRQITKVDLFEVSLVSRPLQPDARLTSVSIPRKRLADSLGPTFRYGMRVSCDLCLQECDGMSELND